VTVEADLDRPNLHYEVWPKPTPRIAADQLAALLLGAQDDGDGGGGGSGGGTCSIVYCHSQAETERVCDMLVERGVSAAFYHAQARTSRPPRACAAPRAARTDAPDRTA
jgi:predicted CxxxxCH...CXXCH cytochrome family protein